MGAVTWKNIAPVSSAGILDSIAESGKLVGTGISGIGDAITGYADDRQTRETDALINDLLQFENRSLEADAFLKDIDTSWLDMARITETRKGLDSDADELAMFTKKENIKSENEIKLANLKATATRQAAAAKKNKPIARGDFMKKLAKRDTIDGSNPYNSFLGFDSPIQDMDDLVQSYIKTKGITDTKQQDIVRSIIFNDAAFDTDLINEYYFGNSKSADNMTVEDIDALVKAKKKLYILDKAAENK